MSKFALALAVAASVAALGGFEMWTNAPGPGVLTFTLSNAASSGVVYVNGTKYRELSYGVCMCEQHFAMPVTRPGWYSVRSYEGEVKRLVWGFGNMVRDPFKKLEGCNVLTREWVASTRSELHWVTRPCQGAVRVRTQARDLQAKCAGHIVVNEGAGDVLWHLCKDVDPFQGQGYGREMQFAVWVKPLRKNDGEGMIAGGVLALKLDGTVVASDFWTLSVE